MKYCQIEERTCINCGYKISEKIRTKQNIIYRRNCPNYKNLNHQMALLYTKDGNPAFLGNTFHNQACFFMGAGPSLLKQNLSLLSSRGILTFSVNNIATVFRPNLWCCVDDPKSFHGTIWNDPTIMKFISNNKASLNYYMQGKKTENSMSPAKFAPNTFAYNINNDRTPFNPETFLTENHCCWGNHKNLTDSFGIKGHRSVMLVALKLIYWLGFKRIYLLGCDFEMKHDDKKNGKGLTYAFSQYKHIGGVATNNDGYLTLSKRLNTLKPLLEKANVSIFNCTPNSKLDVFPVMSFEEAIIKETKNFPSKVNIKGMYGGHI